MPETLSQGAEGHDVALVQLLLVRRQLLSASQVDGLFGSQTGERVATYQDDVGLTPDGVVGPFTWSELLQLPPPRLAQGDQGPAVRRLQGGLAGQWYTGSVDGSFGPLTHQAVVAFQQDAGRPADGVADRATWASPVGAAGATLFSVSGWS